MLPDASQFFNSLSLHSALQKSCAVYAERSAVSCGKNTYTYSELYQEYESFRFFLDHVDKRVPVLVKLNSKESSLPLILAAITSKQVPLFCDPIWKEDEIIRILKINAVNYYICEEETPFTDQKYRLISAYNGYNLYEVIFEKSEQVENNLLPQTAFCRFTSGTTGFSRCLQFTETAFLSAGFHWWQASQVNSNDRVYCMSTLNNGLAFNTSLLSVLFSGAHLVIHKGNVVPSVIKKAFETFKPTILIAFPFVYEQLIQSEKVQKSDLALRLAISSAAPLAPESAVKWREKFGINICNYYGIAEVGPCTFNDSDEDGSLGRPLANAQFKFEKLETGGPESRVLVKTSSMALAYLDKAGDPFSTKIDADGFYISNDKGFISEKGNLILKGRIDRNINIEGRKIDPVEIENLIKSIEGVKDVYVCKKNLDDRFVIAAYVEAEVVKAEDIRKLCVKELAQYKIPQFIKTLSSFPRSSTGKISSGVLELS